jgi:hypothetical protein
MTFVQVNLKIRDERFRGDIKEMHVFSPWYV